jgi:hypothetical protein
MPEEIEVPTEGLQEKLGEAAEEAEKEEEQRQRAWIARVAVSSALLAAAAAISSLLAGHHVNEAIFERDKATDQWALYQAKSIKQGQLETKIVVLEALGKPVPLEKNGGKPMPAADKVAKYEHEKDGIKELADELEVSAEQHMGHHVWFARAVTAFQIAIALGAIAVLARRPKLWLLSVGLGGVGSLLLVLGLL